jgi:hypothetical protein
MFEEAKAYPGLEGKQNPSPGGQATGKADLRPSVGLADVGRDLIPGSREILPHLRQSDDPQSGRDE